MHQQRPAVDRSVAPCSGQTPHGCWAGVGPPNGQSDEFVGGVQQLLGGTLQTSGGDVQPATHHRRHGHPAVLSRAPEALLALEAEVFDPPPAAFPAGVEPVASDPKWSPRW